MSRGSGCGLDPKGGGERLEKAVGGRGDSESEVLEKTLQMGGDGIQLLITNPGIQQLFEHLLQKKHPIKDTQMNKDRVLTFNWLTT